MTGLLQVAGGDDRNKMTNVQAVRRGINAQIEGHGLFFEGFVEVFLEGDLCQKTAFFQNVQNMLHEWFLPFYIGCNGILIVQRFVKQFPQDRHSLMNLLQRRIGEIEPQGIVMAAFRVEERAGHIGNAALYGLLEQFRHV